MNDLQRLVAVMDELELMGIHFESRIKFVLRFEKLDDKIIVLDSLSELKNTLNNSFQSRFVILTDVYQFNISTTVDKKLRYGFTYQIFCHECGRTEYVSINCSSGIIPEYCDDCQDKFIVQGS